nr:gypsy/Ty3 retroelement polyprotein [Tanacetum cinerariifolium]
MPSQTESSIPVLEDSAIAALRDSLMDSMREELDRLRAEIRNNGGDTNVVQWLDQTMRAKEQCNLVGSQKLSSQKFGGEDVTGWMFRCEQFFTVDNIIDEGMGIGAVLQQNGHPISFMSKTLAPKHQSLSTYEKEFLAVIQALDKWRSYLLDRHFIIKTDHFSLKYLMDQSWANDTMLHEVIKKLQKDNSSVKNYIWSANQLLRKGKLVVGNDSQLRQEILRFVHEGSQGGHSGVQATLKRLCAQ